MGCGTTQRVILPTLHEPKWKEDQLSFDQSSKSVENTSVLLLTDKSMITITKTTIKQVSINLPTRESGYILLKYNSFLVAGGYDIESFSDSNKCFEVTESSISPFTPLPYPSRRLRLVCGLDSIFAVGGVRELAENEINLDYSCNFFCLKGDKWLILPDLPRGVEYPACHYYSGKIYVVGGCVVDGMDLFVVDFVQVFDVRREEWETLKMEMPKGLYGAVTVEKDSNSFLLLGGVAADTESSSMSFIVTKNEFEEICPLDTEVSSFFPFSSYSDDRNVILVNDVYQVVCLQRLARKWTVLRDGEFNL